MKKIMLLIFIIISAITFADEELFQDFDTKYQEKIKRHEVEFPSLAAFDIRSMEGKRFIIKNSNVPITFNLIQMCILVEDMFGNTDPGVVNNHVKEWEEKKSGGYAKQGMHVEVVKDLRSDISPIVKVKTLDREEEAIFYMSASGLNEDPDAAEYNEEIDKNNSLEDDSQEEYYEDEDMEEDDEYD